MEIEEKGWKHSDRLLKGKSIESPSFSVRILDHDTSQYMIKFLCSAILSCSTSQVSILLVAVWISGNIVQAASLGAH